jgi:hypothetical protein
MMGHSQTKERATGNPNLSLHHRATSRLYHPPTVGSEALHFLVELLPQGRRKGKVHGGDLGLFHRDSGYHSIRNESKIAHELCGEPMDETGLVLNERALHVACRMRYEGTWEMLDNRAGEGHEIRNLTTLGRLELLARSRRR